MFRSRLFRKLFLAGAGFIFAAAIAIGVLLAEWAERRVWHQTMERLRHAASVTEQRLASLVAADKRADLQTYVAGLEKSTGFRFELLDLNANREFPVQESTEPATVHSNAARERPRDPPVSGSSGSVMNLNGSRIGMQRPVLQLLLRHNDQAVGLLVVSADEATTYASANAAARSVWFWTTVVAVVAGGVAYVMVSRLVRPIVAIREAVDAIAVGDYRQRVYLPHRDEIGALARSFNRMSQELDARMTQLRQSGQRHATVLGGMIEGVIAVDNRQRVLFANAAAGKLFDFSPPAAEGRPLLEVVRVHALHEAVSAALANRRPERLEAEFDAGERLSVAIQVTPMPGQPCPGTVLVLHDMTELRRLERVRQEFVANVSHELKTPISSIKAYAETLRGGALDDRETSRRFIAHIEEQADRLHALILDMLTLARIESDQQVFDIVSVGVEEVVEACLAPRRAAAESKQLSIAVEIGDPTLKVKADREGLREILDNLVDNAIKYTPHGGQVTVRCQAGDSMATIEVEDTGIGIAEDQLARVFERFYRVDTARSREMGGTGLGLSIVKHITQSLGGTVHVRSEKGVGSTFTVQLPLA